MTGISIGPFAFAAGHLVLVGAVVLAVLAGGLAARRGGRNPESMLFNLLLLGLLVARVAFVVRYWAEYRDDPLQILDIRDGGFLAWPGLLAVLVAAALGTWRCPALRRPLGFGLGAGVLFWLLANLGLSSYEQGTRLPDVTLQDAAGRPVRIADFSGRPLVINLWATWCPPCRREMPVLQDAQARHEDVVFLFANQGESDETVAAFFDAEGLTLRNVVFDFGHRMGQEVGSAGLPTTVFYGADGRLLGSHVGELSRGSLARYLERLEDRATAQTTIRRNE